MARLQDDAFDVDPFVLADLPFAAYYAAGARRRGQLWVPSGRRAREVLRPPRRYRALADAGFQVAAALAVVDAELPAVGASVRADSAGLLAAEASSAHAPYRLAVALVAAVGLLARASADATHLDYFRDVVEPDDAAVLMALAAQLNGSEGEE